MKTIIPVLENRFPAYAKDYRQFKSFMMAYFEYLAETGNPIEYASTFLNNTDSTNEAARYWDKILADIGWKLELGDHIHKRVFVLFVRDYYLSRGTKKSLKFLFRLLYSEDVDVYYPRDDMLVLSNSAYYSTTLMVVDDILDMNTFRKLSIAAREFGLIGEGVSSKAKMIVDSVIRSRGHVILSISTTDQFQAGESIRLTASNVTAVVKNVPHCKLVPSNNTTRNSVPVFANAYISKRNKGNIESINVIDDTNATNIIKTEPASGFFATFENGIVTIHSHGVKLDKLPAVRCGDAIMEAVSASIGVPTEVTETEPNIEFKETEFGYIKEAVFTLPKRWKTDNHILGVDCVLTDSHYYQQFSYRIDSQVSRPEYEHIVKDEVHPAGVVMFSRLKLTLGNKLKELKNANISIV